MYKEETREVVVDKGEDKVSDLDDKKRTEHHVVEAWINADSKAYLREVGSSLYDRADSMDFTELCRDMNIVDGPPEYTKPRNVGLLFFSMDPERFYPYSARIEVVELRCIVFSDTENSGHSRRRARQSSHLTRFSYQCLHILAYSKRKESTMKILNVSRVC